MATEDDGSVGSGVADGDGADGCAVLGDAEGRAHRRHPVGGEEQGAEGGVEGGELEEEGGEGGVDVPPRHFEAGAGAGGDLSGSA